MLDGAGWAIVAAGRGGPAWRGRLLGLAPGLDDLGAAVLGDNAVIVERAGRGPFGALGAGERHEAERLALLGDALGALGGHAHHRGGGGGGEARRDDHLSRPAAGGAGGALGRDGHGRRLRRGERRVAAAGEGREERDQGGEGQEGGEGGETGAGRGGYWGLLGWGGAGLGPGLCPTRGGLLASRR